MRQSAHGYSDKVNPDFAKAPAVATREENLLGILLLYPDHCKKVFEEALVYEEDFFTDFNRRVYKYLKSTYYGEIGEADVNLHFNADEVGRITKMKVSRMDTENGVDVLLDSIALLKDAVEKKRSENTVTVDALNDLLNTMRNKEKDGK